MSKPLRICTLGGLSVSGAGGPLSGEAVQPRRLALLALLAVTGDRGVSRDRLVLLLWPEADEERARRILSQALYSIRKGSGVDDLVLGTQELRLNSAAITSDVLEFTAAWREGDLARAAEVYHGAFLDGFHLPGAADFERWADETRRHLSHDFAEVLERLAQREAEAGNAAAAVRWWRKLTAQDPLNARHAVGLMRALAAAGDRAGAVRHARVYHALVEQELDLAPDRDVVALARELESAPALVPAASALTVPAAPGPRVPEDFRGAPPPSPVTPPPPPRPVGPAIRGLRSHPFWVLSTFLATAAALVLLIRVRRPLPTPEARRAGIPVLIVGRIADYGAGEGTLGRPLADLVATDLARTPTLRVLSTARSYELLAQLHLADTGSAGFMSAAREAGATDLLDGSLYHLGEGHIRLDLRRVDVGTGRVTGAYSVQGNDPFVLADSLTAELARDFGLAAPGGPIADYTTRSIEAYRAYGAGLRAYYQGDRTSAEALLGKAVLADSQFAMAFYYYALASTDAGLQLARMDEALAWADHASDRERLIISATWSLWNHAPSELAVAETLAVRYPAEVDSHLLLGNARYADEDFAAGIRELAQVVAMDSLALRGGRARCAACEAYLAMVYGYSMMDSLPAAFRVARAWARAQPTNPTAWRALASVEDRAPSLGDPLAAYRRAEALDSSETSRYADGFGHLMVAGRYAEAESLNALRRRQPVPLVERIDLLWDHMLVMQQLGHLQDALAATAEMHRDVAATGQTERDGHPLAMAIGLAEAHALRQAGQAPQAILRMDSLSKYVALAGGSVTRRAAARIWILTELAGTLAEVQDTIRLKIIADTMDALAPLCGGRRDRRLPHYVHGLLESARRRDSLALEEFVAASTFGADPYGPPLVERARILTQGDRAGDAVSLLRQVLSGTFHFYLAHSDLHAELAVAWMRAGNADSARAHLAELDREWATADAPVRSRLSRLHALLRM